VDDAGLARDVEVSMMQVRKAVVMGAAGMIIRGVVGLASAAGVVGALVPCIALAQTADQASNDRVDLRPKFKTGDVTRFAMDLNITSSQQAGEAGAIAQTTKQTLGLALKVKEAKADGTAKLDLVYESIKLEATSPMMTTSFDSTQPAANDDQTGALLRPLVGLTLALETDERGGITKVTPQVPAGSAINPMALQQFAADDIVKGLIGPVLSISAGSGFAKVGESWVNESVMQGAMGSMSLKNTYTLRSHQNNTATLDIKGTMGLSGSATGLAEIKDGSIRGVASWDTKAGMLRSMEMTQRMQVTTKVGELSTSSTNDMTVRIERK
jgi:hypothetical protein